MKKVILAAALSMSAVSANAGLDREERENWETCAGLAHIVNKWEINHLIDVSNYPEMEELYRNSASSLQIRKHEKELKKFIRQVDGWYDELESTKKKLGMRDDMFDLYLAKTLIDKQHEGINNCF